MNQQYNFGRIKAQLLEWEKLPALNLTVHTFPDDTLLVKVGYAPRPEKIELAFDYLLEPAHFIRSEVLRSSNAKWGILLWIMPDTVFWSSHASAQTLPS